MNTCQTSTIVIDLVKLLTIGLCCSLYFLSINSLWFTITISIIFGNGYYLLWQSNPQLMLIATMVARHQFNKIKNKWLNYPSLSKLFKDCDDYNHLKLQTEDNYTSLEYYDVKKVGIKDKKYIYLFNEKLRSNDVIIFTDEFGNDITRYLEPYLGPMQNFHGVPLTPRDFNHKKITIFRDGDVCLSKTFQETEPMLFG